MCRRSQGGRRGVGIGFGDRETSEEMDTLNILTLSTDFCAQNCFMLRWIVQAFWQLWVPCNLFSRQLTRPTISSFFLVIACKEKLIFGWQKHIPPWISTYMPYINTTVGDSHPKSPVLMLRLQAFNPSPQKASQ